MNPVVWADTALKVQVWTTGWPTMGSVVDVEVLVLVLEVVEVVVCSPS